MKKLFLLLLAGLAGVAAFAQPFSAYQEVMADVERAGGVHRMYPTDQPRPTAAPKGYKPFYVSHLGRHGARFALGHTVYEDILAVWENAREKGWLTPEGEQFYQEYVSIYPLLAKREGQLTLKGQEQHRFIADQLYRNYPAVFKGKTRASAVSTVSHRVIVSMFSFLDQATELDDDLTFKADYSYPYQAYLLPEQIDSPEGRGGEALTKYQHFRDSLVDSKAILHHWFTRPCELVKDPYGFVFDMHTMVSTLDNMDFPVPEHLYSLFTAEERYALWRVNNFRDYQLLGRSPDTGGIRVEVMKALYQDFVDKADADWKDGVQLRLRFSHDSCLMPFLSYLGVNGMDARVENPLEVEKVWRNYHVPMACNLQLVFFRSKHNPEILFQLLLNGREATLPLPMAAPGSFYRWEDFKNLVH